MGILLPGQFAGEPAVGPHQARSLRKAHPQLAFAGGGQPQQHRIAGQALDGVEAVAGPSCKAAAGPGPQLTARAGGQQRHARRRQAARVLRIRHETLQTPIRINAPQPRAACPEPDRPVACAGHAPDDLLFRIGTGGIPAVEPSVFAVQHYQPAGGRDPQPVVGIHVQVVDRVRRQPVLLAPHPETDPVIARQAVTGPDPQVSAAVFGQRVDHIGRQAIGHRHLPQPRRLGQTGAGGGQSRHDKQADDRYLAKHAPCIPSPPGEAASSQRRGPGATASPAANPADARCLRAVRGLRIYR